MGRRKPADIIKAVNESKASGKKEGADHANTEEEDNGSGSASRSLADRKRPSSSKTGDQYSSGGSKGQRTQSLNRVEEEEGISNPFTF